MITAIKNFFWAKESMVLLLLIATMFLPAASASDCISFGEAYELPGMLYWLLLPIFSLEHTAWPLVPIILVAFSTKKYPYITLALSILGLLLCFTYAQIDTLESLGTKCGQYDILHWLYGSYIFTSCYLILLLLSIMRQYKISSNKAIN